MKIMMFDSNFIEFSSQFQYLNIVAGNRFVSIICVNHKLLFDPMKFEYTASLVPD